MSDDPGLPEESPRTVSIRLVIGALLAAAVLVFVFQNTDSTEVTWLVFEFRQPLWVLLLVTAALTLVAAELLGAARRRRRRRSG
ncbi:MAG: DUF1049 domain-containing protein [Acidimicrobiales bacterium]